MLLIGSLLCQLLVAMGAPALFSDSNNEVATYDFPYVNRAQWLARPPKRIITLPSSMPYVVIHHSYSPPRCNNTKQCRKAMRSMQDFHMDDRGWWDIGYHFAVGSDGVAYEGRGWGVQGAHALHFNTVSIGICLIGDWTNKLPSQAQIKTAQALIAAGVEMGHIKNDYKLVGHKQVRQTECPGRALFEEIKKWDRFSPFPASVDDLPNVDELKALPKQ